MELEPRGRQRRTTVVGDRTPHRRAVTADGLGFRVISAFEGVLYGPADASNVVFEFLFGVTIGFVDALGRLAQVVELAQL